MISTNKIKNTNDSFSVYPDYMIKRLIIVDEIKMRYQITPEEYKNAENMSVQNECDFIHCLYIQINKRNRL